MKQASLGTKLELKDSSGHILTQEEQEFNGKHSACKPMRIKINVF
jgi:hypothetical protein